MKFAMVFAKKIILFWCRKDKEKNAREIIEYFLDGQGTKAVELIKELDENDPTFPPAELIVASLQIAAAQSHRPMIKSDQPTKRSN